MVAEDLLIQIISGSAATLLTLLIQIIAGAATEELNISATWGPHFYHSLTDVIIHQCLTSTVVKLNLGHGLVIISNCFAWMWLLMHALILVLV